MMPEWVGLMLDMLLLLFLATAIFFGWRLSLSLNVFRKSRKDLDRLMQDLSRNIEKAELSIASLKSATRDAARDLQGSVNEARALSAELQLMTQSGDNLASRLERTVERTRDPKDRGVQKPMPAMRAPAVPEQKKPVPQPQSSFAIRDPDYDMGHDEPEPAMAEENSGGGFQTKAERELYAALQRSAKNRTGGF